MSDISTGSESSDVEGIDDWIARFRKVQVLGAELAVASGIELADIPRILREERRNAKPEDLDSARQSVNNSLARRQAGK